MTTPTREAIIERAFAIHHSRNHNINFNNPEIDELKEDGSYDQAKRELMISEKTQHLTYLEKQANELGYALTKEKIDKETSDFQIDIEEALRSGVFISGGKGTTKSNLAKTIVDKLMQRGIIAKIFDISRSWLKSSVPRVYEIGYDTQLRIDLYQSAVFDLSRLTPKMAKEFISKQLEGEWNLQISIPEEERKQIVYVFEEVQMLIPQGQLRSEEAQYVLRLMTTGRNFQLGFIAITQRPALCDTSVFELSFQRYFSRMDGENDLKKVSNYIGSKKAKQLQNLRLGEFFYDKGTETKLIRTEVFRSNAKPSRIQPMQSREEPEAKKESQPTAAETDWLQLGAAVFQLGALFLFLACLAIALSGW